MPPRKRTRVSAATTPLRETQPKTPSVAAGEKPTSAPVSIQNDRWTDEEEAMLFKSLVRWKPTGMHKHFRMLAIFESFRSNGFGSGKKSPPNHVRIPGIWAKLNELYDLETLDERENAHAGFITSNSTPNSSSESTPEPPTDFTLPIDPEDPEVDFGELIWASRFAKDKRSESPQVIEGLNNTRSEPGVVLSGKDGEDDDSSQVEEESTPSPIGKASGKPAKKTAKPAARRTTRRR